MLASQAWAVQLSVESKSGRPGERVQIAVRTDNTTGLGIIAVQFVLTYNGSILTARSATTAGTIASSWGAPTYNVQSGMISISMASATPLSGSGNLVIIEFEVSASAAAGQSTPLNITQLQLNEGTVPGTTVAGTFTVTGGGGGDVTLTAGSASAAPGASVTIPVSISDATGKGFISMQMDLDFTASLLTATNVNNTGAITASWGTPTVNIQAGKVRVSMASATPLSGSGPIFFVTFTVSASAINGQSSPLTLSQVSLNEGAVSATLVNGAINVVTVTEAVQLNFPPATVVTPGMSVFVPLAVARAAGKNIIAASLAVTYTPALATAAEVSLANGVVSGWTVAFNVASGKINIAIAGSSAIPSDGELLRIRFDISSSATPGSSSPLNIQEVTLNSGNIPFVVQNGALQVRENFGLSGAVRYFFNNQGVRNVNLQLTGAASNLQNSAADGSYRFDNLAGGNYTLTPSKDGDIAAGVVSHFDASMVLRSIVGGLTLTADQKIAADADGNGNVQAFDGALILQYVTGIITQLPVGDDWTFAPKKLDFTPLSANLANQNFKAIVYGDVSGNFIPALHIQNRAWSSVKVGFPDTTTVDTTKFSLPLQIQGNSNNDIFSFGGTIKFNPKVLVLKNINTQTTLAANWGNPTARYATGEMAFALAGASPLLGDGNILWLNFDVIGAVGDTSGLYLQGFTFNEGSPSAEIKSGFLRVSQQTSVDETPSYIPNTLYLSPNYPNPIFAGRKQAAATTIAFELPQAGRVSISIFNLQGQLIRRLVDQAFAPGTQKVTWDGRDEVGQEVSAGVYLYRLETTNEIRQRKLMLVR